MHGQGIEQKRKLCINMTKWFGRADAGYGAVSRQVVQQEAGGLVLKTCKVGRTDVNLHIAAGLG